MSVNQRKYIDQFQHRQVQEPNKPFPPPLPEGRILAEKGVWKVPEEERPPNWRSMNIKEPCRPSS